MATSLDRLNILVGQENIAKLKAKKVLICGCGGVGSFVAEGLARSGVGCLILVDFDVVEISNLNRQLMSDKSNIGTLKTEALKNHLQAISNVNIECINGFIDEEFMIEDVDYVVDCIDTLKSKFILAQKAHEKNIPFIASMGTARRLEVKNIVHTSLDKTNNDPLAKAYRNLVKKANYRHKIEVVYCDYPALKQNEGEKLGSAIFTVGSVGLKIASIVFNNLLKQ